MLARERYYDGLAILRVQDNYVVQWGDPNSEKPELARKVEAAQSQASEALARATKLVDSLDERLAKGGAMHGDMADLLAKATNIAGPRPHADRVPFPAVPPLRPIFTSPAPPAAGPSG